MAWIVNVTDEFAAWYDDQEEAVQDDIDVIVHLLEEMGPLLSRPYADALYGSRFSNMKELRVRSERRVFRIAFAFDRRREALLLCGGTKGGMSARRFYEWLIARADRLFAQHLLDSST